MRHPDDHRPGLSSEDRDLARQMMLEAVEAHHTAEHNLDDVRETFYGLVGDAWSQGSFVVQVERLIANELWRSENARAGRTAARFMDETVRERTVLSPDEWLDQVIVVGVHRRTTVRHVTRDDLVRIVQVREDNHVRTGAALETARQATQILDAALEAHGDIETALDVGALAIEFDAGDETEAAS